MLAQELRSDFFDPEIEHGLPRRIEFLLWPEPLSEGRVYQHLRGESKENIKAALSSLEREGRIVSRIGKSTMYEVASSSSSLVNSSLMRRIDAANNMIEGISKSIWGSFFSLKDPGLGRTVKLHVHKDDLNELDDIYRENIFKRLEKLEGRLIPGEQNSQAITVCYAWVPNDIVEWKK